MYSRYILIDKTMCSFVNKDDNRILGCYLPIFNGKQDFSPWASINVANINNLSLSLTGVYVIGLWIPCLNSLAPIYVGSGKINQRLHSYYAMLRGNKFKEGLTPKYIKKLLQVIDCEYWCFSFMQCSKVDQRTIENEVFHQLKETPFLINARSPMRDKRYQHQFHEKKIASPRTDALIDIFELYN